MTIQISRLSPTVIRKICLCLDIDIILELNQVSKSIHELIAKMVTAQSTAIRQFLVNYYFEKIVIRIDFYNEEDSFMWNLCLNYALGELSRSIDRTNSVIPGVKGQNVQLDHSNMLNFLMILKPYLQRVKINALSFIGNLQPEIIQMCAIFLGGLTINTLQVKQDYLPRRDYFDELRNMAKTFKIENFGITCKTLDRETMRFLLSMGCIANNIKIGHYGEASFYTDTLNLIKELLNRKCQMLTCTWPICLEVHKSENILERIIHLNKKMYVRVRTFFRHSYHFVDAQIGAYKVHNNEGIITIKHL